MPVKWHNPGTLRDDDNLLVNACIDYEKRGGSKFYLSFETCYIHALLHVWSNFPLFLRTFQFSYVQFTYV